jgi:hypothetical protein
MLLGVSGHSTALFPLDHPLTDGGEKVRRDGAFALLLLSMSNTAALGQWVQPHPATAPAGSNRSSHEGNEVVEAFD